MSPYGIYLLTLWQAIQRAEETGFASFAHALRSELASEMMRTNRKHFFAFMLSL